MCVFLFIYLIRYLQPIKRTVLRLNYLLLLRLKCLFKLYDISVIMLPTNNIIRICSEISKILFILRMVYTCGVKGIEENEKMGRK